MNAKGRILIVDDEPYQLLFMEKALQSLGYETKSAGSPKEALEKLRQAADAEPVDVLITDMSMPDGDGVGLIEQARKEHPALSIFINTALKSLTNLTEAMRAGADGYLLKPIELELLKLVLERELRVRDAFRKARAT